MGQGAHTVLAQIVAESLGVELDSIRVETPDTSRVPDSGPTVASRTTMVVGSVLEACAQKLRASSAYAERKGPFEVFETYRLPPGLNWDEKSYRGDAYPTYAWGSDIAEVEVDMETFEVKVLKMTMAQDVGRAVNPKMAVGQIEGGTLQALGYALFEREPKQAGRSMANRLATYIIPTSVDAPEFETILVEEPFSHGPGGAKGLGELPMDGGAPAIANAVFHATGLFISELPITPEKLYEAWCAREGKNG